jgi:hypothetical protein
MANRHSFDAEIANLDAACRALRSFTLASRGANRKSGLLAIDRVNAVCERMNKLFATGSHALRLASILNSVRGRILAAEARLTLLARKPTVTIESL